MNRDQAVLTGRSGNHRYAMDCQFMDALAGRLATPGLLKEINAACASR